MSDTLQATQLASPVLVLGPAHAGKSEFSIQVLRPDAPAVVIGTAPETGGAPKGRIAQLRSLRPAHWESTNAHGDLPAALAEASGRSSQVLVDSVSQWLAGVVVANETLGEPELEVTLTAAADELVRVVKQAASKVRVALVSAEAGAGPPPTRMQERLYRRSLGLLNQRLAGAAGAVVVLTAGIPQRLKG